MASRKTLWAIRAARLALLCALILGLTSPVLAADDRSTPWPDDLFTVATMLGHAGKEQITLTCVPPPEAWNGILLVYAHGYVGPHMPLALPTGELSQIPGGEELIGTLLNMGFAFATTSYSKNGYAIEQADADLDALVRRFKTTYGKGPVLLVGASEGALITVRQIEKDPTYAGGLALCGPVAGMPYQVNFLGDFRVLFDYFFDDYDVFPFGAVDGPQDAWTLWDPVYVPAIGAAMGAEPVAAAQLLNVTGAAYVPAQPATAVATAHQILFYSVVGMHDAIATARGIPYDNRGTWYSGSFNDDLLNQEVERVKGDRNAIAYTDVRYEPTGRLRRPLVTLHNTLDPAVPYEHELIYGNRVAATGSTEYVTQMPVPGYGHCNFTAGQVLGAFGLLLEQTGLTPPAPGP